MSVRGINDTFLPIPSLESLNKGKALEKAAEGPSKDGAPSSFGDLLENAIKEVNSLQTEAEAQIEGLTLKKEGVTPHSAMVALEKADVAFQLMSAVRSKIIRAYEEVIRTQV